VIDIHLHRALFCCPSVCARSRLSHTFATAYFAPPHLPVLVVLRRYIVSSEFRIQSKPLDFFVSLLCLTDCRLICACPRCRVRPPGLTNLRGNSYVACPCLLGSGNRDSYSNSHATVWTLSDPPPSFEWQSPAIEASNVQHQGLRRRHA
jgi:hypothetical protein